MVIPLSLIFQLRWILIILLLFGGFIILFYDKFSEFISVRFFKHVFFLSSFLFALAHFHQIDAETIFERLLIIIIAYFPIGIYFGYVRMKSGLPIVICMHSLLNFSVLAINSLIY
ncbi:MAG: type II CAAX prenyl endopeptidase Rce1 family protein [Bacteroidales bacterium]